ASRGERGGRPTDGVDEGPHLDDEGRRPERGEEPAERSHNSSGEHASRLSGPGAIWAESQRPGSAAPVGAADAKDCGGCGPGPWGDPPHGIPPGDGPRVRTCWTAGSAGR